VKRWPVRALGAALLAACVGLAVAVPSASPGGPGVWTSVEGPNLIAGHPAAVRGQDGSLFIAFTDVNGDLAVSKIGADGTRLSTEVAISDGGSSANGIASDPATGQLRVLYGGFRSPPGESGTWSATAPAIGTPWSAVAKIANLSSALTVATTSPDGTVYIGRPDPPAVHRGTDPADPDNSYAATSGQDAGIATDGVSGAPFLGWLNSAGSDVHVTVRQGSAATGAPVGGPLEAPGLGGAPADAIVGQAVPLSGRIGAGGVYTAYVDESKDSGELLLWRVGDPAPRQAAIIDGNITRPALAPAPDGSLWIIWFENVAQTGDKIAVRQLRPDGSTLGPVTRLDLPPTTGLVPSDLLGVAQADRLDVLASDTAKHIWHTQVPGIPTGGGGGGGAGAGPGALSGRVTQPDGTPVPSALIEACPQPSALCLSVYTDADGRYRFDGLPPGDYVVVAWPPKSRFLIVSRRDGVSTVSAGAELPGQDIVMQEPIRRPKNVALFGTGLREFGGVPRINPDESFVVIIDLSGDVQAANYLVWEDGPKTIGEPGISWGMEYLRKPMKKLEEKPICEQFPDLCKVPFNPPPLLPKICDDDVCKNLVNAWYAQIRAGELKLARLEACIQKIAREGLGGQVSWECFSLWIDPSGNVRTTRRGGLPGAKVVLLRSDARAGPFVQVDNGSEQMSPANRRNPDVTDQTGHFGWDVVSGHYKVAASKGRCTDPRNRKQKSVETQVYAIPPPVTDIDLRMRCPPPPVRKKPPKLSGRAHVGRRLTCSRGKWRNKPKRYQYVWRRGRVLQLGARKPRYSVRKADRGKKLSCQVYATNSYGTGVATSKAVRVR
jgi:carboxypeptidase family protein